MILRLGRRSYRLSRRRHTPEQVVRKLREADRLLGEGIEVFKALEVSGVLSVHSWLDGPSNTNSPRPNSRRPPEKD